MMFRRHFKIPLSAALSFTSLIAFAGEPRIDPSLTKHIFENGDLIQVMGGFLDPKDLRSLSQTSQQTRAKVAARFPKSELRIDNRDIPARTFEALFRPGGLYSQIKTLHLENSRYALSNLDFLPRSLKELHLEGSTPYLDSSPETSTGAVAVLKRIVALQQSGSKISSLSLGLSPRNFTRAAGGEVKSLLLGIPVGVPFPELDLEAFRNFSPEDLHKYFQRTRASHASQGLQVGGLSPNPAHLNQLVSALTKISEAGGAQSLRRFALFKTHGKVQRPIPLEPVLAFLDRVEPALFPNVEELHLEDSYAWDERLLKHFPKLKKLALANLQGDTVDFGGVLLATEPMFQHFGRLFQNAPNLTALTLFSRSVHLMWFPFTHIPHSVTTLALKQDPLFPVNPVIGGPGPGWILSNAYLIPDQVTQLDLDARDLFGLHVLGARPSLQRVRVHLLCSDFLDDCSPFGVGDAVENLNLIWLAETQLQNRLSLTFEPNKSTRKIWESEALLRSKIQQVLNPESVQELEEVWIQ